MLLTRQCVPPIDVMCRFATIWVERQTAADPGKPGASLEKSQRRSKTMRALTWPFSTSSKHSLTSSSFRVSRITWVRP